MDKIKIPILFYHSHRVRGITYETNDHVALHHDLRVIQKRGFKIIPLYYVVEWFLGRRSKLPDRCMAITFDDGCDLDWIDFDHPQFGLIKGFKTILDEFRADEGDTQPYVHASSFVIGSQTARRSINDEAMPGVDILNDDWWKPAENSGIFKIYNHSWDHNHPAAGTVCQKQNVKGSFDNIDTYEECQCEVKQAMEYISKKIYPALPDLFAYPYGQSSNYIREKYFSQFSGQHHTLAAFGASGGYLTKDSFQWNLPRFGSGASPPVGWRTTSEFIEILDGAQ
jgi:hypothetical protein